MLLRCNEDPDHFAALELLLFLPLPVNAELRLVAYRAVLLGRTLLIRIHHPTVPDRITFASPVEASPGSLRLNTC